MSDPTLPPDDEVRRAADILAESRGADALNRARLLEEFSTVPGFAGAVAVEVERRLAPSAPDVRPGEPSGA